MIQIRAPRRALGSDLGSALGRDLGRDLRSSGQIICPDHLGRDLDRDLRQDLLDRDLGKNPSRIGGG